MRVKGSFYKSYHRIFQVENRVFESMLRTSAITDQLCSPYRVENIFKLHN